MHKLLRHHQEIVDNLISPKALSIISYVPLDNIMHDGMQLQYITEQTDEICLCAVKQNGLALKYVLQQTDEICLCAVRQDGCAIEYVINKTNELCLIAIHTNPCAVTHLVNPTKNEWIQAINIDPFIIRYLILPEPYREELLLLAVTLNPHTLNYIDGIDQTEEMCKIVVTKVPQLLGIVWNQTVELCIMAINISSSALRYVRNQTEKICMHAVMIEGATLSYVINQTDDICVEAVKSSSYAIHHIRVWSLQLIDRLLDIVDISLIKEECKGQYITLLYLCHHKYSQTVVEKIHEYRNHMLYMPNNIGALPHYYSASIASTVSPKLLFLNN